MKKKITVCTVIIVICIMASGSAADDTDRQLRAKWNLMCLLLKQGNTRDALKLIHADTRVNHEIMFETVKNELPQIIATQSELTVKRIQSSSYAEYELTTKENGKLYSYDVIFKKDMDGEWYILEF